MQHLLEISDLTPESAAALLGEAALIKQDRGKFRHALEGKTLAMLFEKPSLRTRVSFDTGMAQLGGHALFLSPAEVGLGQRESVPDVARVLSRMCDGIMARVMHHDSLKALAGHSSIPVINGLSDFEHPCQALADLLTVREHKGWQGRKLAYVGDGNNVCRSLMLLCTMLGLEFRAATPPGYEPEASAVEAARQFGTVTMTQSASEAVQDADIVYTDVWTSMGQEDENERRMELFPPYQVSQALLRGAAPDAIVMHCLPAHRGQEITDEVMEGSQSVVFDQAENRLHAQKAVLLRLMA